MMNRIFNTICLILITAMILTGCGNSQPKLKPLLPDDVILAFGDSLTFGSGASAQESYPVLLEEMTGYKVINAGVPGEESKESIARISTVLDESSPALVIVCIGGNDFLRKRPLSETKNNLKKIVEIIQQRGIQVILLGVPSLSVTFEVPPLYSEVGNELHIPINNEIIRTLLKAPEYKSDYIHFNKAGYRLLAKKIAAFLKEEGAISNINSGTSYPDN